MELKCYKEDNKTKINMIIVPTREIVAEAKSYNAGCYYIGYWGSVNVTINNEPKTFNYIKATK